MGKLPESRTFYSKKKSIVYLTPLERKAIRELKRSREFSVNESQLAMANDDIVKKSDSVTNKKKVEPDLKRRKSNHKKIQHTKFSKVQKSKPHSFFNRQNSGKKLKIAHTCSWAPKSLTNGYLKKQSSYKKCVPLNIQSSADLLHASIYSANSINQEALTQIDDNDSKENMAPNTEEICSAVAGALDASDSPNISKSRKEPKEQTRKLFSIFTKEKPANRNPCGVLNNHEVKKISPEAPQKTNTAGTKSALQYIIDAGQKKFGAIQCSTCGMVYAASHPGDEQDHARHHKRFLAVIKFPGWKTERVVASFMDGRIIKITTADPQYSVKKVTDMLSIVDVDLGFKAPNLGFSASKVAYFFVSDEEKIVGCLIAERISKAFRLIYDKEQKPDAIFGDGLFYTDSSPVPAVCGVSRIWTYAPMRRNGIATRLVDSLRATFVLGMNLDHSQVAFSDPTPDGRQFAFNYFKTKNILVYNLMQ